MIILTGKRQLCQTLYNADNIQMLCITVFLILLVTNLKCTEDHRNYMDKWIRDLYQNSNLFLQWINGFRYIQDNYIIGDILGWTTSDA